MEPEGIIKLFDSIWFNHEIFSNPPKISILKTNPDLKIEEIDSEPKFSKPITIHVRSKSDQLSSISSVSGSFSPNSVLLTAHLQTIFSGKEAKENEKKPEPRVEQNMMRKKTKKGTTKSLSDLEFEELKGFMDLGFVFSEKDVNSSLVEIIPGLQRLGKKDEEIEGENVGSDDISVPRPYLSEAWKDLDRRKMNNPLMNWKIPDLGSEIDVKNSLKWWAHSVASAVR